MNQISRKYVIYLSIGILVLLGMISAATYAIFFRTVTQSETNVMRVLNCVSVSFLSNTDSVNLSAAYPMSDEEGLVQNPFNFTIVNNCNNYVEYSLIASIVNNENRIEEDIIKIALDGWQDVSPVLLSDLNPTPTPVEFNNIYKTYTLTTSELFEEEAHIYNYRMWLDDTEEIWQDDTLSNKTLTVKLSIIGIVKPWVHKS